MATLYQVKQVYGIYTSKTVEVKPKSGKTFSLSELQDFVEGYIEIIDLRNGKIMVVNEEGKLKDLPFNHAATKIYAKVYSNRDIIVGNALVCKSDEVN
jgi:hypothetical protein